MDHKELDVWKMGVDFVADIYRVSGGFPKEELYGLTSQLRRAAVSIPSNIAEGAARNSDKECIQFMYVALGSLSETETQIIIARKLCYMDDPTEQELLETILTLRKMLTGLIKYLKKKSHCLSSS